MFKFSVEKCILLNTTYFVWFSGKKVFLGFIPNDQTNFVERIREEIRKEKSKRDILAKVTNNMNLVSSSQQYHHQQQQQQQPSRQQQQPQQSIIQQQ